MFFLATLQRAFASNLQSVASTPGEQKVLIASGVQHPIIQNYLAWRKSVLAIVVICTVLSTGLTTYQWFSDAEERPDILKSIESEIEEYIGSDLSSIPAGTEEVQSDEESSSEDGTTTTFGEIADLIQWIAWYALPLSAFAAMILWTRFRLTYRIMVVAFSFSFLLPILLALCPWSWTYAEPIDATLSTSEKKIESIAYGVAYGLEYLITLLPTVLALVPGVQRACLRVKTLLPQSILPGWLLVAASPFYALVLLVMFVAVNQIADGPYFFVGMLLLLSAPLCYFVRADIVTKPLSSESDFPALRRVQICAGATTALAGSLLLIYLCGIDILGIRIFGFDPESSLLQPLDIAQMILETIGKSMFITVLGADILMRMNASAWRNLKDFAGSQDASGYDAAMEHTERMVSSQEIR